MMCLYMGMKMVQKNSLCRDSMMKRKVSFKVSTKDIATDLYIYVIDESRMSKKKTDTDFREELEQRAIVRKVIHLQ